MSTAEATVLAEQRSLLRSWLAAQSVRGTAEASESYRRASLGKAAADAAEQRKAGVETGRVRAHQQAESLRQRATSVLTDTTGCNENANGLLHLLRRRGDFASSALPASPTFKGQPELGLNQSLAAARDALGALELALGELAAFEANAARVRLLLALTWTAVAIAIAVYFWDWAHAIIFLPLIAGIAIAAFRLDHGVVWLDRLFSFAAQKGASASSKPWYSFTRNYFAGLNVISNLTDGIRNPYVQSGTRATVAMYFTGSALGVALAAGYAIAVVVVGIVIVGFVLWLIGKILENA